MTAAFSTELQAAMPHVFAVALIAARLLPIAFLCPLLGGAQSPTHIKLGIVVSLSLFLHVSAGIAAHSTFDTATLAVSILKEVIWGTSLGLIIALPFETARMAGRFIDQFRGSSVETAVLWGGGKESASGDVLYQLLLALVSTGPVMPIVLSALFKTFMLVPIGTFAQSEATTLEVVRLVGIAFSAALAIGAPVAAASLAVDAFVGLASRANPNMGLQELSAPLRLMAGAAVLWLSIGLIAERTMALAAQSSEAVFALASQAH